MSNDRCATDFDRPLALHSTKGTLDDRGRGNNRRRAVEGGSVFHRCICILDALHPTALGHQLVVCLCPDNPSFYVFWDAI